MTEEEKKAIEILKNWDDYRVEEIEEDYETMDYAINKILNLIDKQQKEIEELKQANEVFKRNTIKCRDIEIATNNEWEDKIRDIIKELEENIRVYNENSYYDPFYNTDYVTRVKAQIIILKSLLKEGEQDAK